jgi:hypothetical protein
MAKRSPNDSTRSRCGMHGRLDGVAQAVLKLGPTDVPPAMLGEGEFDLVGQISGMGIPTLLDVPGVGDEPFLELGPGKLPCGVRGDSFSNVYGQGVSHWVLLRGGV